MSASRIPDRRVVLEWVVFILPLPLLLAVVFLLPLAGVFEYSVTMPERGFQNYLAIAENESIRAILIRTLRICAIVTVISVTVAYLLAYHWLFGPPLRRRLIEICVLLPFWLSVLVRAFGWLIVLRNNGLLNETLTSLGLISEPLALVRNEIGVIIGMVHFMIPYAVFPLMAIMRQIDPRISQAARGLGAGRVRSFVSIFLPLSMPGIIGAGFIVFIFTLGFFITPTLLGGGRVVLVAEYIYTQITQTANWGVGTALSVVLLGIVIPLIWLLMKLTRVEKLIG